MKLKYLCFVVVAAMALLACAKSFAQEAYSGHYVAEWRVDNGGVVVCDGAARRFVINSSQVIIGDKTMRIYDVEQGVMYMPYGYDEINVSKCSSYVLCSQATGDGITVPFCFELSQHPVSTVKGKYYLFKIPFVNDVLLLTKEGGQKSASPKSANTRKTTKRKATRRR